MREYYGASVGVLGERQKFLRLLEQENESIASWETRIRNQAAHCEYQDFVEELMRDQFIAGLTSAALRVKLIGKGHRHKTTQAKVKLREVVEVAKTFEATTFANQLMKTARNTQQKQVKYTTKSPQSSQCFWCGGKHQQPRHQYCPASVQGWNTTTSSIATIQFFSEDTEEETFVTECDKAQQFARK